MAKWQRHLRMQPEWGQAQEDELTIQELAGVVAKRLRALRPFAEEHIEEKRDELAEEFEWIAKSPDADREDFDSWMEELYDWGDTRLDADWNGKKVCWIDAIGVRERA